MSKKSKHAKGTAFSVEVCDAIRHHVGEIAALESKRKNAFADRDAAIESLSQLKDHSSKESITAKSMHSDAVREIDALSCGIKWHRGQIDAIVGQVDAPQLDLPFDPPDEDDDLEDDKQLKLKDDRPVGRVGGKPGPVKPAKPDPAVGTGQDEHLSASISELSITDHTRDKITAAGYQTVRQVIEVLEDKKRDACDVFGITYKQLETLMAQVQKYRKAHRKAMVEAERAQS